MTQPDFAQMLKDSIDEALRKRGRVNILIAGKSGVGKSTLINAVFAKEMATTGQGRPVTQETREITKEGVPVSIFDTRGLELANHREIAASVERFIKERNADTDPQRHIHIAWVCINEDSRRVEEGESDFVEMLARYMPVVAVITKSRSDNGFRNEVQRLLPVARNVARVRAISETLDEGMVLPPFGLKELVELTMELVPDAHRNAFAAAQRIDLNQKVNRSHLIVAGAATLAAGVGAVPVPFSDCVGIVPIQVGMLAGISATFGLDVTATFLGTLLAGASGGVAATLGGQALVGNLFKLIPGAGSVVGGLITGGVAATVTTAFGEAYVATLYLLLKDDPTRVPTAEEIAAAFKDALRKKGATVTA